MELCAMTFNAATKAMTRKRKNLRMWDICLFLKRGLVEGVFHAASEVAF